MKFWFVVLLTAIGVSHADNAAIRDLRSANGDLVLDIVNGSKHGFSSHFAIDEEREVIVQSLDKVAKSNRSDAWDRLYQPSNIVTLQQQEHILNAYTIITVLQELAKIPSRDLGEIFKETLDKCFEKTRSVLQVSKDRIAAFSGKILSLEGFLKKDFSVHSKSSTERKLDINNGRSDHYLQINFPKAPIIHPYNPVDLEDKQHYRKRSGMLTNTFNVKLPTATYYNLPPNIKNALQDRDISPQNTDIFFLTQDNPWKEIDLLFRPQTWIDEVYSRDMLVGFFSDDGVIMRGHDENILHSENSSIHSQTMDLDENTKLIYNVSSPDNMKIDGLDYQVTKSFYPVVIDGDRAVVTLIWMLNDEDQAAIESLSLRVNNMKEFIAALNGNAKFAPHFAKLKSLMRY
jgi:hypothetical protein